MGRSINDGWCDLRSQCNTDSLPQSLTSSEIAGLGARAVAIGHVIIITNAHDYCHANTPTGITKDFSIWLDTLRCSEMKRKNMAVKNVIRNLVNRALLVKQLTPEIEEEINLALTVQGYISDTEYEALEYLMKAMDEGKIRLTAS
ncbi:hypothetical protein [Tumidithrix helvetica]|uniref:hypothetical protein n=1 Tax=Tumidithrix helvetica TaxID=3457545 RepID=UPI003CC689F0